MKLFEEADCVIAVGASMNRFTIMGYLLYPNARYVHMDSKPHVMMGGGRSADCYVQSDARAGVEALESLLAKRSVKLTGYRTPEVKKSLAHHFEDRTEFLSNLAAILARSASRLMRSCLPMLPGGNGQRCERGLPDYAL